MRQIAGRLDTSGVGAVVVAVMAIGGVPARVRISARASVIEAASVRAAAP